MNDELEGIWKESDVLINDELEGIWKHTDLLDER
jgi:hypothetical protein